MRLQMSLDIGKATLVNMKTLRIFLIATLAVLCGCYVMSPTTARKLGDEAATEDRAAINKLLRENITALNARDLSALVGYYAEDAIQFPPNSPALTGRAAIRSTLESGLKGVKVTATIEVVEVFTAERWAFARCTYRMVTTPQGGGQPITVTGNWLNILRRQPDDSWRITRSSWSSEEQPDTSETVPGGELKDS